jgi:hypothetical protein
MQVGLSIVFYALLASKKIVYTALANDQLGTTNEVQH